MGGNNGRFRWLLNSGGEGICRSGVQTPCYFWPDRMQQLCPKKVLLLSGKHVCVARGSEEEEEEEEDGLAFQNGGGIISGSRKRQRIRVAVWMARDTPPRRRVWEEGHNGKMPRGERATCRDL